MSLVSGRPYLRQSTMLLWLLGWIIHLLGILALLIILLLVYKFKLKPPPAKVLK